MTAAATSLSTDCLAELERRAGIAIVSEQDARGLEPLTPHRHRLLYPSHWQSPYPSGNIYAEAFERGTFDWLDRFGLVKEERDRQAVRKFSCGAYGGYSSPRANFRNGLLHTQFVSLWLLWDDRVVEDGTRWSIEDAISAMGQDRVLSGPDNFLNAWNDLCVRLRQTQSPAWMARLGAEMDAWMQNAKRETDNAGRFEESGTLPEFDEMLDIRTVSIGMYPTFHLIEMCEGFELPASFHDHDLVREMKRLASRLVGFGNDIGGFAKDLADGWPNLISALQKHDNLSIDDAFRAVVDMHNADVHAFDELHDRLPSWGPVIDVQIQGWVQAVRYSVVGFTLWESRAERYQQQKVLVGGKVLSAPVSFFQAA